MSNVTLAGNPISFEPNPPGVSRAGTPYMGGGFNNNLVLYQNGTRLLMSEAWGYSILDISNPVNPTALYYHDVRFPRPGSNSVDQGGDGQSNVFTVAVSPDGQRLALGMSSPTSFHTVVGSPDGVGFTLWGDFYPDRPSGTLIQQIGGRYIAYDILPGFAVAADITTLPTSFAKDNMTAMAETTTWPGGQLAILAGNYILYQGYASGTYAIQIYDASAPGPIGRITAGYPGTTITSADFGGRTPSWFTAAVDPSDTTKLWVLVELSAQAGENSPSYGLLYVTSNLTKVSAGPIWRVPSQAGDTWLDPGAGLALIPSNGNLFPLMWAKRVVPSLLFELYSTTTADWGAINSSAPPGKFDIPSTYYSNFSPGQPMRGFSVGNSIYAYLPTGSSAYVIPMTSSGGGGGGVIVPNAPTGVGASKINNTTIRVTWTPPV